MALYRTDMSFIGLLGRPLSGFRFKCLDPRYAPYESYEHAGVGKYSLLMR